MSIVECYTVVAFSFPNSIQKSIDLKRFCAFGAFVFFLVAFSFPNSLRRSIDFEPFCSFW